MISGVVQSRSQTYHFDSDLHPFLEVRPIYTPPVIDVPASFHTSKSALCVITFYFNQPDRLKKEKYLIVVVTCNSLITCEAEQTFSTLTSGAVVEEVISHSHFGCVVIIDQGESPLLLDLFDSLLKYTLLCSSWCPCKMCVILLSSCCSLRASVFPFLSTF